MLLTVYPLILSGNKKGHTYLNKPAAESLRKLNLSLLKYV